jgi:hypothetical protein
VLFFFLGIPLELEIFLDFDCRFFGVDITRTGAGVEAAEEFGAEKFSTALTSVGAGVCGGAAVNDSSGNGDGASSIKSGFGTKVSWSSLGVCCSVTGSMIGASTVVSGALKVG